MFDNDSTFLQSFNAKDPATLMSFFDVTYATFAYYSSQFTDDDKRIENTVQQVYLKIFNCNYSFNTEGELIDYAFNEIRHLLETNDGNAGLLQGIFLNHKVIIDIFRIKAEVLTAFRKLRNH
jgi:hypothetical protein